MALEKYPGTGIENAKDLWDYIREAAPDMKLDEVQPPAYDKSKAIFIRDEKSAARMMEEDDLLLKKDKNDEKLPTMFWGMITKEAFLLVYTSMMTLVYFLSPIATIPKKEYHAAAYGMYLGAVNLFGFTALMLKSDFMLKLNTMLLGMKLMLHSLFGIIVSIALFQPDFCKQNFVNDATGLKMCLRNLNSLRWMAPILLMTQLAWEAFVLSLFKSQTSHAIKIKKTKMEKGKWGTESKRNSNNRTDDNNVRIFSNLDDVDTTVGHPMTV